jgi:class 3 adenylate cyclase
VDASSFDVVALIACGMGVAFWATDRDSPTSRALALFLFFTGLAIAANGRAANYLDAPAVPWWVRGIGLLDAVAFIAGTEWGIRVGRTIMRLQEEQRIVGRLMLRLAQGLTLVYAGMSAWLPEMRLKVLVGALEPGMELTPGFYVFALPGLIAGVLVILAGVRVLRHRPDKAEVVRILAMLGAMPLLGTAMALPREIAPFAIAAGEIVFLFGALRYHVVQGARGQFMARFLAPQVAELVRERGLKNAMAQHRLTVSVVCCDIRGFTAYAQARKPEQVLRLLRDFYGAVGSAAERDGGTIKDLAGDGVLILLGAPVPFEDHARRAISLARRLQTQVRNVVKRRSDLGLGVGVASGQVAAGIVGQGARFEYVAVGPTVNLASRLCDEAADGEVLVEAATMAAAGEELEGVRREYTVKGRTDPVSVCVMTL